MRTTIDLPDELYRTLKARAAFRGTTLRELIHDLIERGLTHPGRSEPPSAGHREAPPVIIAPRGTPIRPLTAAQIRHLEEEEDESYAKVADGPARPRARARP